MMDFTDAQLATELRMVISRLMKKLRSHAPSRNQLSITERGVIRLLDEQSMMLPGELAKREQVSSQSMSQILNHLFELGYIVRQPLATDRRTVGISLSEIGREFLRTTRHERDEWLSDALRQVCSADERDLLRKAIGPLNRLLDVD